MNSMTVCQQAGITYRQLSHWARTGRIPGWDPVGTGLEQEWTYRQRDYIVLLGRLTRAGFTLPAAHKIALALNEKEPPVSVDIEKDLTLVLG